ncbi:MAG: hypothetical protein AB1567_04315 [bacterium]
MDEIAKNARNAKEILDNPLYKRFFKEFRDVLFQEFERSQQKEKEKRERIYIYLYFLNKFQVFFETFLDNQEITERNLKEIELKKKFLDKFNFIL